MRSLLLLSGIVYMLFLVAFWSLLAVAGRADRAASRMVDRSGRPCPVCSGTDVYVDDDDVCFCITCQASYPLANVGASS